MKKLSKKQLEAVEHLAKIGADKFCKKVWALYDKEERLKLDQHIYSKCENCPFYCNSSCLANKVNFDPASKISVAEHVLHEKQVDDAITNHAKKYLEGIRLEEQMRKNLKFIDSL